MINQLPSMEYYLDLPSWEALIQIINDNYAYQLFPDRTKLISVEATDNNGGTKVTLAASVSVRGQKLLPPFDYMSFYFKRLDLGEFFEEEKGKTFIRRDLPIDTTIVTDYLADKYDLVFSMNDIQHEMVTAQNQGDINLKAEKLSLRWVGSLDVAIKLPDINVDIDHYDLEALMYPSSQLDVIQAPVYGAFLDDDPDVDTAKMTAFKEGFYSDQESIDYITHFLNVASGGRDHWVVEKDKQAFNLCSSSSPDPGFSVMYNGDSMALNDQQTLPGREGKNALLIQLIDEHCSNMDGMLHIYYSPDKED